MRPNLFRIASSLALTIGLLMVLLMTLSVSAMPYLDPLASEQTPASSGSLATSLSDWENLGIYGAHVNGVAYGPTTGTVYLAANGGYYKSIDYGQSWAELVDVGGQAVAVDPIGGRVYLARTGVWVSTDDGTSWTMHPEADGQIWAIAVDPNDGQAAFAGTGDDSDVVYNGHVHRTLDGGQTWMTTLVNVDQCIESVAVNPLNGNNIWAVGGQCSKPTAYSAVYSSTDRGASFALVFSSTTPTEFNQVVVAPNGIVYAGGNGVWVSSDGGQIFNKTHALPISHLIVNPVSGQIYVDGYHTTNGQAWIPDGLPGLFGIDPHDPARLLAPSGQGLRHSANNGITWQEANTGIHEVLVTEVTADPHDASVLYAVSQNGFARSRDNGATWDFPILMGGAARNAWAVVVNPVSADVIYVGENGGAGIWRSPDGGDFWVHSTLTSSNSSVWQLAIDPNDPNIVYAAVSGPSTDHARDGLYGTTNGGQRWERVGLAGWQVNTVRAVSNTNGTTVYAGVGDQWTGTTTGGVFRRFAGEGSWTQVGPPGAVAIDIAVDPRDPNHLYVGVGPSLRPDLPPYGILESTDAGNTWTQILTTTSNIWTLAIDPQNPAVIYASTLTVVYQSLNGGDSWSKYYQGGEGSNFQILYMPSPTPLPVTQFTATLSGSNEVDLSWLNPMDTNFAGTLIHYSTITYPLHYDEGQFLTDQSTPPAAADTFVHTGLMSGTTYYYAALAHDGFGHYSPPILVSAVAGNFAVSASTGNIQTPLMSQQASTLYLGTDTGLYRRSVSLFRTYLPAILRTTAP